MTPEELYARLTKLIEDFPYSKNPTDYSAMPKWLGEGYALVNAAGQTADAAQFQLSANQWTINRNAVTSGIFFTIAYRALAATELRLPARAQNAFLPVGHGFDAMSAVMRVFGSATNSLRIVDPYMDGNILSDFIVHVADGIHIELLTDVSGRKAGFAPALRAFQQQFGASKPVIAKESPQRTLHDRLIIIDAADIWLLSQSFNALASRSPAYLVKMDGDAVPLKLQAYNDYWNNAAIVH